jgi:hypothetical protein
VSTNKIKPANAVNRKVMRRHNELPVAAPVRAISAHHIDRAVNAAQDDEKIEPEIHREMGYLTNANRDLYAAIEELGKRLQHVLLPAPESVDGAARIVCETLLGHRIREEQTAVAISVDRVRDLITRLAI